MVESRLNATNYKASFLVPDFVEIQRRSFSRFLERGIPEEFSKINPIRSDISRLKLTLFPERYLFILPDCTVREALLQGKTYSCKLYLPAMLSFEHDALPAGQAKNGRRRASDTKPLTSAERTDGKESTAVSYPLLGPRTSKPHLGVQDWASPPRTGEQARQDSPFRGEEVANKFSQPTQSVDPTPASPWSEEYGDRSSNSLLSEEPIALAANATTQHEGGAKAPPRREKEDRPAHTQAIKIRPWPPKGRPFAPEDRGPTTLLAGAVQRTRPGEIHPLGGLGRPRPRSSNGWPKGASPSTPEVLQGFPDAVAGALPRRGITAFSTRKASRRGRSEAAPPPASASNVSWVLVGNMPLMTKRGHFIVNGSPRVVVNQLVRSPGVYFHERAWGVGRKKKRVVYADFVSRRGAWLRIQAHKEGDTWARLKKTPKIPFSLFYDAMGACERSSQSWTTWDREILHELHEEVNPTRRDISAENGCQFLMQRFKNPRTYDLGAVGRNRLNRAFGSSISTHQLTSQDLYAAFERVQELQNDQMLPDDIDHLKNRRVRASGELVQGQFEIGVYRLEKAVLGKMRKPPKEVSPRTLVNTKPLNGALREFFGSSPLSQYMDQTNPLAEITQKRRISSLGPGGISRETAGMAVRGIHPTHYGRICPIETPEGKNAGLVNSLTVYTRIGKNGILETPYYPILHGQIQRGGGFRYFSAEEEEQEGIRVAPGDVKSSTCQLLPKNPFPVREIGDPQEDFRHIDRAGVSYIAISPIQMISIATSLIPFLEHDDANRALMGSNMQRQAVPLLRPERPIVGTGLEASVVGESGHALQAKASGYVSSVNGATISVYTPQPINQTHTKEGSPNRACPGLAPRGGGAAPRPLPFKPERSGARGAGGGAASGRPAAPPRPSEGTAGLAAGERQDGVVGKSGPATPSKWSDMGSAGRWGGLPHPAIRRKHHLPTIDWPLPRTVKELLPSSALGESKGTAPTATHVSKARTSILAKAPLKPSGRRGVGVHRPLGSLGKRAPLVAPCHHSAVPWRWNGLQTQGRANSTALATVGGGGPPRGGPPLPLTYDLQSYHRSNQETCLTQVPAVREGDWVQKGDLLADCSASQYGELALGKNILIAYLPWEGYNFEDAVVISERLVSDDVYTSIHIQKYEIEIRETRFGFEKITHQIPGVSNAQKEHLSRQGIASIGSWVREGDILVGKVSPRSSQPLSPYERLAYDIANVEAAATEDTSLRVPKGVEGRVINCQAFKATNVPTEQQASGPGRVRIYLAEKRKIQVGDKVAGRHGNKGIVSRILPRQDMPYLPNGSTVDMVLNPLGIPSRMNVGQVFECLLGLAGMQLGQQFKVTPFDEIYGVEASRSLVYLKLYQARLRTNQDWVFDPRFPGKSALFDGRSGRPFDQWVTVGQAYMLKLVHLVDEKIHARSTGPYSLVTKQPLGGRSKHGGQRLGEMEVWALEGFGAAYTLQEMLTSKSDDIVGREQVVEAILFKGRMSLGNPEAFKVLVRELQSLCLDVGVYAISPDKLHREVVDVGGIP